jgi:hypothetical protein
LEGIVKRHLHKPHLYSVTEILNSSKGSNSISSSTT